MTMPRYRLTGYDRGTEPAHEGEWVRFTDAQSAIKRARDQALEDAAVKARDKLVKQGQHRLAQACTDAILAMKGDTDDR